MCIRDRNKPVMPAEHRFFGRINFRIFIIRINDIIQNTRDCFLIIVFIRNQTIWQHPVNSLAFQIIASVSRDLNPFMRTIFVADDSFAVISENQISYSTYRTKKFIALL